MLIYVLLVGGLVVVYKQLPTSFLPSEDQGAVMVMLQMPPNATLEQTKTQLNEVSDYILNDEKDTTDSFMFVAGFGMGGIAENTGMGSPSSRTTRSAPSRDRTRHPWPPASVNASPAFWTASSSRPFRRPSSLWA